jgi:peptidoglycan/xylan/chitin deacetylase (PgdA/CDA1 family)
VSDLQIIISHDIDHWSWFDHLTRDLFLPKHVLRTFGLAATGRIGPRTALLRCEWLWRRQQHRLDELIRFNRAHGVPATFFIGMANGLSLSYSLRTAGHIVEYLRERGCARLGVHGIAFDDLEDIERERARMQAFVGSGPLGIRMHYLRCAAGTLSHVSKAGYAYDSTTYGLEAPYWVGDMLEFPISMMDVRFLSQGRNDLAAVKNFTLQELRRAERLGIGYFTLNFHDTHFCEAFEQHRAWYRWLIPWLAERGYAFTDFARARDELLQTRAASASRGAVAGAPELGAPASYADT